jgi:hypothetical protein
MGDRLFLDWVDVAGYHPAINEQMQLVVRDAPDTTKADPALRYLAQSSARRTFYPAVWQRRVKLSFLAQSVVFLHCHTFAF